MQHISNCKDLLSGPFSCETCIQAKFHRLPFNKSSISTTSPFQLIHMDLWGLYKVANVSGAHYFLTIVDDFTICTWTQLLQDKTQAASAITNFFAMVATQYNTTILQVRIDNGAEFINGPLLDFFANKGILLQ